MARLHVEAEGVAQAAPEVVWELVANADRYHEWGPWSASGYQNPGDHADGPGVIRWMRYGRTTTVEKVLEAEKGRRLTYTVVKGIPVRNYRAEVTLTPEGRRHPHPLVGQLGPDASRPDCASQAQRHLSPRRQPAHRGRRPARFLPVHSATRACLTRTARV